MGSDYTTELFKEFHADELERMDKLDGAVGLPTAILTVLFGVGSYYLQNFPSCDFSFWVLLFYLLCLTFGILLLVATCCLIRSVVRGKVALPANPGKVAKFISDLEEYYTAIGNDEAETDRLIEQDLREGLHQHYIECSSRNRKCNLTQGKWLYRTKFWIAVAFAALVLSAIPFLVIQYTNPDKVIKVDSADIQKVEIIQSESE